MKFNMPSGMNFQLKIGLKNHLFDISTPTANDHKSSKLLMQNHLRYKRRLGTPVDIPAEQRRKLK
jgi:hypothetical protein